MPEKRFYLDSSALAKRYVEETGSSKVDALFGEAERGEAKLVLSLWNVGELVGVLDKYERAGLLDAKSTLGIFLAESKRLERMKSLELVPVSGELISTSLRHILKHHIYVADALQIATCTASSCDEFVTADESLSRAAKEEKLNCLLITS